MYFYSRHLYTVPSIYIQSDNLTLKSCWRIFVSNYCMRHRPFMYTCIKHESGYIDSSFSCYNWAMLSFSVLVLRTSNSDTRPHVFASNCLIWLMTLSSPIHHTPTSSLLLLIHHPQTATGEAQGLCGMMLLFCASKYTCKPSLFDKTSTPVCHH